MNWTQIKVECKPAQLDMVCAVMSLFESHLQIEDASDVVEANPVYGELIDESLLQKRDEAAVSFYVSEEINAAEVASLLDERFRAASLDCHSKLISMNETDWANNWKQYYKPVRIGKRLVIVPEWEDFDADESDVIVKMDPGMAFGTGTHESTQLCAALLEEYMPEGVKLLDVGTGSGILAIAAVKLGAAYADGFDIDPMAVRVAGENAQLNGCENTIKFAQSDLLSAVSDVYGFVTANITAEIVMRMAKDIAVYMISGACLAVSGVIDEQCDDVVASLEKGGLKLVKVIHDNGWSGILMRK